MKQEKSELSVKRIITAELINTFILLIGCMISAGLLAGERIREENAKYLVMGIIMLSSLSGTAICVKGSGKLKILYCIGIGMAFFLILLAITGLFFGGLFRGIQDIGATLLLILCGSTIAAMIKSTPNSSGNRRRKHGYR